MRIEEERPEMHGSPLLDVIPLSGGAHRICGPWGKQGGGGAWTCLKTEKSGEINMRALDCRPRDDRGWLVR
jgi:hypothetical protein